MHSFFVEEIYDPEGFKKQLIEKREYHILALTPLACYQLDVLECEYNIPDDFLFPSELTVDVIKEIIDDCKSAGSMSVVYGGIVRATNYWNHFLKIYLDRVKPKKIEYEGEKLEWLLSELRKASVSHEGTD